MKKFRKKQQSGITLIIVIMLLSVVAVIAVSLATISGSQNMSSAYTYRGTQGYFAARAGLDYALARIVGGNVCAAISPTFTVSGYTVAINCAAMGTYNEGNPAAPYTLYALTATASRGGFLAPDVANRQVRAIIKFP